MILKYNDYLKMVEKVREVTDFKPLIGVVLGTGLGSFIDKVDVKTSIYYKDIPNLPISTNPAHQGRYVFGYYKGIPCVFMQGRVHYYEGFDAEEVIRPIRLMGALGIKKLILTNAAGGINFDYKPGDFMLIEDHIDCFIPSPLRGENDNAIGTRFPDMSDPYNSVLVDKVFLKAKELKLPIHKGVFIQYPGPQFETKALIKAFRNMGADACGMSTAIEAVASNHMNIKTIAISFISNMACGIENKKITDEEVVIEAKKSEINFTKLLGEAIEIVSE